MASSLVVYHPPMSSSTSPRCNICGQLLQYRHTDHVVLAVNTFLNVVSFYHPSTPLSGSRHLIISQHGSPYYHGVLCVDSLLYYHCRKSPSFVTFTILTYFHDHKTGSYPPWLTLFFKWLLLDHHRLSEEAVWWISYVIRQRSHICKQSRNCLSTR